jgi:hypothetical protein
MNSNTHSVEGPPGRRDGLDGLAADLEALAAQDLDGLPDSVRAARVLRLRGLVDRLEGQWLKELAGVDARGAAGAEDAVEAGSTAGWLRRRLRLGAGLRPARSGRLGRCFGVRWPRPLTLWLMG